MGFKTHDPSYSANPRSFPEHFTVTQIVETDTLNEMLSIVLHIFMDNFKASLPVSYPGRASAVTPAILVC